MRLVGVRLLVLTIVLASVPLPSLAGRTQDNKPPRIILTEGATVEPGTLVSSCWTRGSLASGEITTDCVDGEIKFGPERRMESGDLWLQVRKSQPPNRSMMTLWRKVDKHRRPIGPGKEVDLTWTPHIASNGAISWFASLDVKAVRLHASLFAAWLDEDGSRQSQDATWEFSVTRPRL